jgi:hypothetical protein
LTPQRLARAVLCRAPYLRGASDADGGGGCVLLVVHVEDHDDVHRACQQRVTLPNLKGTVWISRQAERGTSKCSHKGDTHEETIANNDKARSPDGHIHYDNTCAQFTGFSQFVPYVVTGLSQG